MDKRACVVVATNELAVRMRGLGYREVLVLAPWEVHTIKGVMITAVPGLHDIYEIGYVVQGGRHCRVLCMRFAPAPRASRHRRAIPARRRDPLL